MQSGRDITQPSDSVRDANRNGGSCSIVVVDDHLPFADTLAAWVRLSGCSAVVIDPRGAIETACRIREHKPDLVFLDVSLAHFDGCEVVTELRRHGSKARVVAVTGDWRPETAERCRTCGFDDVWHKPVDPARLEAFLDEFVDQSYQPIGGPIPPA